MLLLLLMMMMMMMSRLCVRLRLFVCPFDNKITQKHVDK